MYFPNADVVVNPALLVLLGVIVGTLGGFFGVGGGFLITGGLLVFGTPPLFAVGTGLSLVMGVSLINTLRHRSLGNVDFRLGLLMVIGTVPALYAAQQVNQALEAAGVAGPVIRYLYVVFLATLGLFILWDYWRVRRRGDVTGENTTTEGIARRLQSWRIPPRYVYLPGLGRTSTVIPLPVSGVEGISVFVPVLIGLAAGFFAGILGAGGAFILTPVLIYLVGIPTVVAIGTDLFQVIITGAVGTFFYALAGRVDPLMVVIMLTAASIGSQLGTSATRYVEPSRIRFLYGVLVLAGGIAVGMDQASQAIPGAGLLSTVAAVVLLGVGGGMCVFVGVLMLRARLRR